MISSWDAWRVVFNRGSKCACGIPKGDSRTLTSRLTKPDASAAVTAASTKPFNCLPLTCADGAPTHSRGSERAEIGWDIRPRFLALPPSHRESAVPRKSDSYKTTRRLFPSAIVHVDCITDVSAPEAYTFLTRWCVTSAAITIAGFLVGSRDGT
ncbi:hypothetical protein ACLOJK_009296 [Asimina triloba]